MDCRIDVNLPDHPKFCALRESLGEAAELATIYLWLYCARCCPSGEIRYISAKAIAEKCKYQGDPNIWIEKLVELRLLERGQNGSYKIHDWTDHNMFAATAPIRRKTAQKAASSRWEKWKKCNKNNEVMRNAYAPSPSPSPSPSPISNTDLVTGDARAREGSAPEAQKLRPHPRLKSVQPDWRNAPHPMDGLPECKRCHTVSNKQTLDLDDRGVCCMCRRADEKPH